MPIHAPTMEVFAGFDPVNGQHYQRHTPKSDIRPGKHIIGVWIVKIGPFVFAQLTAERPCILYSGPPSPALKITTSHGGSGLHLMIPWARPSS